jgi:hypothetical protein
VALLEDEIDDGGAVLRRGRRPGRAPVPKVASFTIPDALTKAMGSGAVWYDALATWMACRQIGRWSSSISLQALAGQLPAMDSRDIVEAMADLCSIGLAQIESHLRWRLIEGS